VVHGTTFVENCVETCTDKSVRQLMVTKTVKLLKYLLDS